MKGTSQSESEKRLKSISGITSLYIEEADQIENFTIFDNADNSIRVVGKDLRIILIMNSIIYDHWIHKYFFDNKRDDTCYIHTTYKDNEENLHPSLLQKINYAKKHNHDAYRIEFLGENRSKPDGAIFDNWEVGNFPTNIDFICYGLDFGARDPTTLIKIGLDRKRGFIYCKECFYGSNYTINDLVQLCNHYAGQYRIIADAASRQIINSMKASNLNIHPSTKNRVIDDIKALMNYTIIVTGDSPNLKNELRFYQWSDKKAEVPVDAYNHCIDAMRYAFIHLLQQTKPKRYVNLPRDFF